MYTSKIIKRGKSWKIVVYKYINISFIHLYGDAIARALPMLKREDYEQVFQCGKLQYIKVRITPQTPPTLASLATK